MKPMAILLLAIVTVVMPLAASEATVDVTVSRNLVDAARVLYDGVTGEARPVERFRGLRQRESMLRPFDHADRSDWSYWPRERAGLALANMDGNQRRATQELLASILSSQGHLKVVHIMQLENVLRALDTFGFGRDIGEYQLALFGEPSLTDPWGFRFEGHHVSINVTVVADEVRVTPSFFGSNPREVPSGILTGFRPLRFEEDYGRKLVSSLDAEQKKLAIGDGRPPGDVVSGQLGKQRDAWDEWREALALEGLSVSGMNEEQRFLVERILDEVLGNYRPSIARAARAAVDIDSLVFRWLGGLEPGEPSYYRLLGEHFVFEFDNVQGNATHVHTVWRERDSDFGEDLLRQHYQNEH